MKNNTKALLIMNLHVGYQTKEESVKYIKKVQDNFLASANLPDYVSLVIRPYVDPNNNKKEFEYIKLENCSFDKTDVEDLFPKEKSQLVNVRISVKEKEAMQSKAKAHGFKTVSEYLRFVGLNADLKVKA